MSSFSGWCAVIAFIFAFLLAIKSPQVSKLFGELRYQLKWHHRVALLFLLLLLWHIGQVLVDFRENLDILLDFRNVAILLGWLAATLIAVIISLAFLHRKLDYRIWRGIHLLSSFTVLLALLHVYMVYEPSNYQEWCLFGVITIGAVLGILGSYTRFFAFLGASRFLVEENRFLDQGLTSLTVAPVHQKRSPKIVSGQFVYVQFIGEQFTRIWHPFTVISSNPSTCEIEFLIKSRGRDTNHISSMQRNSTLKIFGPFGPMFWENPYQSQLWIASGVGIAVFLGALRSYPIQFGPRIHLIFTSNEANLIFYSEFEAAKSKFNFTYEYSSEGGFRLVEKLTQNCDFFDQFDYFRICGHPDFQKAINRLLLDFGISKNRIRLEGLW